MSTSTVSSWRSTRCPASGLAQRSVSHRSRMSRRSPLVYAPSRGNSISAQRIIEELDVFLKSRARVRATRPCRTLGKGNAAVIFVDRMEVRFILRHLPSSNRPLIPLTTRSRGKSISRRTGERWCPEHAGRNRALLDQVRNRRMASPCSGRHEPSTWSGISMRNQRTRLFPSLD